ncbi:MAG: YihY/virulence factor BrkB family protein [Candidatus Entotheonellia bacterium]
MIPRAILALLKETCFEWYADRGPRLGAALAFYTLFSLAPLLMIIIAIAALAFGREIAYTQLIQQVEAFIGAEGARVIQATIENTSRPSSGIAATLIGLATMLFGATIVLSELQDALNMIWKVPSKPGRSMAIGIIWDRFLAFSIVLGISVLLLFSIVANAVLNAIIPIFGDILPKPVDWLRTANFAFTLVVVTLLSAMLYKVLPNIEIAWSDVLIGAMVTALLFMIGKFLIELYLGYSSVASVYGAAGSLVVFLIWIYYSAQILYFGAEFTKVYAKHRGHRIVPTEERAPMTQENHVE